MTPTAAAAATSTTPAASAPATSLSSLAGNFNDFLKLLMTQLQNQDPTAPLDTNQFTQQLVQFSSVEQQINTNTSLNKLIDATQGSALLQSTALVGQQVEVKSDQISLQDGAGTLHIAATSPGTVKIGIYSPAGVKLKEANVTLAAGQNSWTWDGRSTSGARLPDGAYKTIVLNGDGTAQPFSVVGTADGVKRVGDTMKVQVGALKVNFGDVQSVGVH